MSEVLSERRSNDMTAGAALHSAAAEHPFVWPRDLSRTSDVLQILNVAERAASECLAAANSRATATRNDAQEAAEQVIRSALADQHDLHSQADQLIADADATAERTMEDARLRTEAATLQARDILVRARRGAKSIAHGADQHAKQLEDKAHQRIEDAIGVLRARHDVLQQQIEALQRFEAVNRHRLTSFMKHQLLVLMPDRAVTPAPIAADRTRTEPAE